MLKFLTVHGSMFLPPVIYVLSLKSQYSPKHRVLRRFKSVFIFRFAHMKEQMIQRNMVECTITFFLEIMVCQCVTYIDVLGLGMSKNVTFRPFMLRPARCLETLRSSSKSRTPVPGVRNLGCTSAKTSKLVWLIL